MTSHRHPAPVLADASGDDPVWAVDSWSRHRPETAAVIAADGAVVTYRDLRQRAGDLAQQLRRHGVGPEVLVGLYLPRCPELVVALLGVLGCGGALLLLDPEDPQDRLEYVLGDARPRVVLCLHPESLPPVLGSGQRSVSFEVLPFERPVEAPAEAGLVGSANGSRGLDLLQIDGRALAYVLYTSGSTGRPKGVAVERCSLFNYLAWASAELLGGDAEAWIPALSRPTFDACLKQLLAPLLLGGAVRIVGDESLADLRELLAFLRDGGDRLVVNTVPSLWRSLLMLVEETGAPPLRIHRLLLGGEPLTAELVARTRARARVEEVVNLYGPTEATANASWDRVAFGAEPTLGRAAAGATLRVVDPDLQPVAAGTAGELLVGGPGVARGYHGRPRLTADRFVPDPGSAVPGSRAYRTGDRVVELADGRLAFLGRFDRQVKLRGFRIELEEIERCLLSHPGVREAAVVLRGEAGTDASSLLAAVAGNEGLGSDELREHLAASLPSYMVPAEVMVLPKLPKLPGGKPDRQSLRRLGDEEGVPGVPPRPGAESVVASAFAEVLGRPSVSRDDDFFRLGGHSLLVVRVAGRLARVLDRQVPTGWLFQAPTPAKLAARLEGEREGGDARRLRRVPRGGDHPLTPAQQRLWLAVRLSRRDRYNLAFALRLRGRLAPGALRIAVGDLVARHESLRTTFHEAEGRAVQRPQPPPAKPLTVVDLRGLPEPKPALDRLRRMESRRPFLLDRQHPFRAMLLLVDREEAVLLLVLHHIATDGRSMSLLFEELAGRCRAAAAGRRLRLEPLDVQMVDYARWLRERPAAHDEEHLSYWRRQLEGVAPPELPVDRPPPAQRSFPAGQHRLRLAPAETEALQDLSARQGATLFMGLLGLFQVLLRRYGAGASPAVATAVANRQDPELDGVIGFFVNLLILRTELGGRPSSTKMLERVRDVVLGALIHQDLPFGRLARALYPGRAERSLARAVLVLQEPFPEALDFGSVAARVEREETGGATFDLIFELRPAGGGLDLLAVYDSELFDSPTVLRLAEHFLVLVRAAAAEPARATSDLPLLSPAERDQLVRDLNGPCRPAAFEAVHELFYRQAGEHPEAIAVEADQGSLSFAELAARARRLADRLVATGVGAEDVVAIYLERSPEMIVGMVAVLTCGAAYLPVDPAQPAERAAFMLLNARPAAVIGRRQPPGLAGPFVQIDDAESRCGGMVEVRRAQPAAAQAAYVIYTSGSTGRPKGVVVSHGALHNLVVWHVATYGVAAGDRSSQMAAPTFDAAVWEIWPPLTAGATLCLPPDEARLDVDRCVEWLSKRRVRVTFLPTPVAEALVEARRSPAALRWLLTGGDRLRARPRGGEGWTLVNHYGPTEATVLATAGAVRGGGLNPPSIGRVVDNVRVVLLDREQRLAPLGAVGEIAIGGAGVARGYLGQPAETARRFIPDPVSGSPGTRLYRTGDLGRWGAGGELDFHGRLDDQVKIRGVRIEPGEVEAALASHPSIQTAVVAGCRVRDALQLVAWVVARPGQRIDAAALRHHLRPLLPVTMLPSKIIEIPRLPLTANGKVDRRALPEPRWEAPEGEFAAPRSDLEALLCTIWEDLLGLERVGRDDDFFALGGDSLLAVQMAARLRSAGFAVSPMAVLESPTVAELVLALTPLGAADVEQENEPAWIEPTPVQHWFFERGFLHPERWNMALLFEMEADDPAALQYFLDRIQREHAALRMRWLRRSGRWSATTTAPGRLRVVTVDLEAVQGPDAERALRHALARLQEGFDIRRAPLARVCRLLRGGGRRPLLLLVLHHLVADAYSLHLLMEDLGRYRDAAPAKSGAARDGRPTVGTALHSWTRRLREWTHSSEGRRYAGRWLDQPWDRVRPLPRDLDGANVRGSTRAVERRIELPSRDWRGAVPVDDLLLAGLLASLGPWCGAGAVLTNLVAHGRGFRAVPADLSRTVGWLSCHFPVVLPWDQDTEPISDLLERVRRASSWARAEGVSFGALRYLGRAPVRRSLAALPEPEVSLNYVGSETERQSPASPLRRIPQPVAAGFHPGDLRPFVFAVFVGQDEVGLTVRWLYSVNLHRRRTAEKLADRFVAAVEEAAASEDSSRVLGAEIGARLDAAGERG